MKTNKQRLEEAKNNIEKVLVNAYGLDLEDFEKKDVKTLLELKDFAFKAAIRINKLIEAQNKVRH